MDGEVADEVSDTDVYKCKRDASSGNTSKSPAAFLFL